jgi:cysteine synthase
VSDFAGKRLDYWVTGYGTGGTLQGVGKVLKAARPDTKIVLSEPTNAPLIGSGLPQHRQSDGSPEATHPSFTAHPIQGWTPDFIPQIAEDALGMDLVDAVMEVSHEDAIATSLRLAKEEGIFCGISGGASMASALQVAAKAEKGSVVLTMLPDTAERYLSTPLFASIEADMNEDEKAVSVSTPGFILGVEA